MSDKKIIEVQTVTLKEEFEFASNFLQQGKFDESDLDKRREGVINDIEERFEVRLNRFQLDHMLIRFYYKVVGYIPPCERKTKLKCRKCDYTWVPKAPYPLSCPRCRVRLGFEIVF